MTAATRLADLRGANGTGVRAGSIEVDVNGVITQLDLSTADSVNDVLTALSGVIQATDPGAAIAIDPATGDRIAVTPSAGTTIVIRDSNSSTTAGDLGLAGTYPGGATTTGLDLDPCITPLTRLDSLSGVTLPLGQIAIRSNGQLRQIDLSALTTIQDLQNAVAAAGIGARVEISDDGTRLNVRNEVSGTAMSIEEVGGNTATELGIRSFSSLTLLTDFNEGRGVRQADGNIDPLTGLPDPAANMDFRVKLKDGRTFEVDIDNDASVQDVLNSINSAAQAAGILSTEFTAQLVSTGNGIELVDLTVGAKTQVVDLNNSGSAEDLGILGDSSDPSLIGRDRATVAVDSVFSHLIRLRDALLANDERGIEFATDKLETDISRAGEARADVGVRSRRIAEATGREEDLQIQDTALRSSIQDLDFTQAATRFASLQQQLEAGLAGAAKAVNLSLLDFLR